MELSSLTLKKLIFMVKKQFSWKQLKSHFISLSSGRFTIFSTLATKGKILNKFPLNTLPTSQVFFPFMLMQGKWPSSLNKKRISKFRIINQVLSISWLKWKVLWNFIFHFFSSFEGLNFKFILSNSGFLVGIFILLKYWFLFASYLFSWPFVVVFVESVKLLSDMIFLCKIFYFL